MEEQCSTVRLRPCFMNENMKQEWRNFHQSFSPRKRHLIWWDPLVISMQCGAIPEWIRIPDPFAPASNNDHSLSTAFVGIKCFHSLHRLHSESMSRETWMKPLYHFRFFWLYSNYCDVMSVTHNCCRNVIYCISGICRVPYPLQYLSTFFSSSTRRRSSQETVFKQHHSFTSRSINHR